METPYKSQRIAVGPGGNVDIPLDFLPVVGKGGGRSVVDKLVIRASAIVTNPAAVTIEGADVPSLISRVFIKDAAGERRDLLGIELGMKQMLDKNGTFIVVHGGPDIAANGTSTTVFELPIYFRQPEHALRGEDYFLPVDDLLNGGGINIQTATAATVEYTGAAPPTSVWNAGSWVQVYAWCSERHDLEYFSRDVVKSYSFSAAANEFMVPIMGSLLRELVWYQPISTEAARQAGTVLTLDTFSLIPYDINTIPVDLFNTWGRLDEEVARALDVVPMRALVYPGAPSLAKTTDMKIHGGQLLVRFDGSSVATASRFIVHTLSPKSPAMAASAAATAGQGSIDGSIKTAKAGSDRSSKAFGAWSKFLPVKQRMKK